LSTPLFEHVGVDMNDDELALSRSTPSARFDAMPSAPAPVAAATAAAAAPMLDADAERFVTEAAASAPVVLFALEWCEFCWSARKLLTDLNVPYRSIDLDSVAFQADDRGGKIRSVLAARTGATTIPRIYIAGEHVGGCTELFDAWRAGTAQRALARLGVAYDARDVDPYTYLPKWLQPRKSA